MSTPQSTAIRSEEYSNEINELISSIPIAKISLSELPDTFRLISPRVYRFKSAIVVKFFFDKYSQEEWENHTLAIQSAIPTPSLLCFQILGKERGYFAMEHIEGIPLENCLHSLSVNELDSLALTLEGIIQRLRSITVTGQKPSGVGSVSGGPLRHILFNTLPPQKYLCSTRDFHEYIRDSFTEYSMGMGTPANTARSWAEKIIAPFTPFDDAPTYFTHGDIGPSNIIVHPETKEFKALIDWNMSGWLPEYWEYCRLRQWTNGPDKPETSNWEYIVEKIFPANDTRNLVFKAYESLMDTMYSTARY